MPATRTGKPVRVTWECLSNLGSADTFTARLTMVNASGAPIAAGWALYFNTCRKVLADTVSAGYTIEHVNGDLFRLTDTSAWPAGQVREVTYTSRWWAISHTDAPLGFYLVPGDGGKVFDLGDPQVVPFTRNEQLHRHPNDAVPSADAAWRYQQNQKVRLMPPDAVGRITPRPVFARFTQGAFLVGRATAVVHDEALLGEATLVRAMLAALPEGGEGTTILMQLRPVEVEGASGPLDEAYTVDVAAATVRVLGATPHAVFNAVQTLFQLVDGGSLPVGRVLDAPRFAYRGMMLDVARHFADKHTVMRLLDCMARYKLNRFHFHLTDDEGWRLAIPVLPELTTIGAYRGVGERPCLPPSFGSGPDAGTSAGSGCYSGEDFVEILRYAHARHIEVVPEFNMPGHARAAVVAMRARHDRLRAEGDITGAQEYLLSDPNDTSSYESVQLWHDNVICIALPSVDRFIDTVVAEVVALYREAGVPLRAIHTGGDEVPAGAWLHSPLCQEKMQENGWTSVAQLRDDFIGRCRDILARHGLAYAGWDETALTHGADGGKHRLVPNPRFAGSDFHAYVWNNAWGSGQEDCAYRLANAGYSLVLSNAANLYFDLAYAKDPEEPGYYWAGFVGTRQAFTFCPLAMAVPSAVDPHGHAVPKATLDSMARLDSAGAARIDGLQGQLWGENARSRERIEYLAAPRLIALAERAWSPDPGWHLVADPAEREKQIDSDWNEFANRLGQRELPRLDAPPLRYGYRLPPPGVTMGGGAAYANVALPGLALHYTVDGAEPSAASPRYRMPVELAGDGANFRIATFDTRGRKSRTVTLNTRDIHDE